MKQEYPSFFSLLFLVSCLFILHLPLPAQSFMPANWQQGVFFNGNFFNSPPPGNASAQHLIDTTMCGFVYAKVCRGNTLNPTPGNCDIVDYFRMAGTRVYYRQACAGAEYTLYDWGLVVGDTINVSQGICHSGLYEVDTVQNTTLLDGSVRKYFVLHGRSSWNQGDTLRWIEDIGDLRGGFVPNCDFEGGHGNLICHKESGVKRYASLQNAALADCDSLLAPWAVALDPANTMAVTLAPQPCTTELRITTTVTGPLEFVLYDLSGRVLRTEGFTGTLLLDTGDLPAGLYLYALTSEGGAKARGRLLRQ